jgi:UDP-glucose 4-epimerase
MSGENVVLVTGVGGMWGGRVAGRLVQDGYRVLGMDAEPPTPPVEGLDFIEASVRNPALADLLRSEGVDTVCHLAFVDTSRPAQWAFEENVTGTTHLLEACAGAGVRRVVLKSSTAVYGARPGNSAFLAEDHALRGSHSQGTVRDLVEIETYCAGFRHAEPEVGLLVVRLASIVGPTVDTPLTRLLVAADAPTLLGFDPLMQVIHEDDAVAALACAVGSEVTGAVNVAAEDALPLSKMRGLAGKPPLPIWHPLVYWAKQRSKLQQLPLDPDYLRYPWVGSLDRMRDELGFAPSYSAEEALRELGAWRQSERPLSGAELLAQKESRLRATLAYRQRRGRTEENEAYE